MVSRKKRILFKLFLVLIVPLVFIILELTLRITGVGYDTRLFIQNPNVKESYIDNPQYFFKYYPTFSGRAVMPTRNMFQFNKSPSSLRGFVIGESTPEGFPFRSNLSFTKILEKALAVGSKYQKVEIINLGLSAMTSYYTKDVALKVLDYKPDFIVIYGGHNEVYGTISYMTGGNYLTKSLYLNFKESRIFQLFYDAINQTSGSSNDKRTLMASQFKNNYVERSAETDKAIAADYIRNLEQIVRQYNQKGIPVIVIEPVSNLIDMPPFAGKNDEIYKPIINKYMQVIADGDPLTAEVFYKERQSHPEYNENANIVFLDAAYATKFLNKVDISLRIKSKDLDSVPFRMRSTSIDALRDFVKTNSSKYPQLHYVPTYELLSHQFGDSVFSNKIFIDQLHFNFTGQIQMANYLSNKIIDLFHFDESDCSKIEAYFKNEKRIKDDIYLLPYYEMEAYWNISTITSDSPFSNMIMPYRLMPFDELFPNNSIANNSLLSERAKKIFGTNRYYYEIIGYYIETQEYASVLAYRLAAVAMTPGDPLAYLDLAKTCANLPGNEELAIQNFVLAYRFSGLKESFFMELSQYLAAIHKTDLVDSIKKQYGNPR